MKKTVFFPFVAALLVFAAVSGAEPQTSQGNTNAAPSVASVGAEKPVVFCNHIQTKSLDPLYKTIQDQKDIIKVGSETAQDYLLYAKVNDLAGQGGHHQALLACINELQKKLKEFEILVAAPYVSLEDFHKSSIPFGCKCFVVGTVAHNALGKGLAIIENQYNSALDLILPQYLPNQRSSDYAFVAYGTKVNIGDAQNPTAALQSEQLLYYPLQKSDFDQAVSNYAESLPDVAAHFYYGVIIPGLKFQEQFARLDREIAAHKRFLEEVMGVDSKPSCPKCGGILRKDGTCPLCTPPALQPKCPDCGTVLDVAGDCPNRECPSKHVWRDGAIVAFGILALVVLFVIAVKDRVVRLLFKTTLGPFAVCCALLVAIFASVFVTFTARSPRVNVAFAILSGLLFLLLAAGFVLSIVAFAKALGERRWARAGVQFMLGIVFATIFLLSVLFFFLAGFPVN